MSKVPGVGWATATAPGAVETTPLKPFALSSAAPKVTAAARPQPLNVSTNVLLAYRVEALATMSSSNFVLAIMCLVFCGLNVALIYFNYRLNRGDATDDDPPITDLTFHLTEFWATFVFAMVEAFALVCTPKSLVNIYENPLVLKLVLFFNIVATLVPALMVTINLGLYEIISHELEYVNEITMSFVDLVLLWSLCRRLGQSEGSVGIGGTTNDARASLVMAFVATCVAVLQLGVYNGLGRTADGDMVGEAAAHYLEFVFSIISSLITCEFFVPLLFLLLHLCPRLLDCIQPHAHDARTAHDSRSLRRLSNPPTTPRYFFWHDTVSLVHRASSIYYQLFIHNQLLKTTTRKSSQTKVWFTMDNK